MQGGVKVMEVTLNTKGALDAISLLAAELGEEMLIGAGTVLDRKVLLQQLMLVLSFW